MFDKKKRFEKKSEKKAKKVFQKLLPIRLLSDTKVTYIVVVVAKKTPPQK